MAREGVVPPSGSHRLFIDNDRELPGIVRFWPDLRANQIHCGISNYRYDRRSGNPLVAGSGPARPTSEVYDVGLMLDGSVSADLWHSLSEGVERGWADLSGQDGDEITELADLIACRRGELENNSGIGGVALLPGAALDEDDSNEDEPGPVPQAATRSSTAKMPLRTTREYIT
jgi:hypothetical protein